MPDIVINRGDAATPRLQETMPVVLVPTGFAAPTMPGIFSAWRKPPVQRKFWSAVILRHRRIQSWPRLPGVATSLFPVKYFLTPLRPFYP